MIEEGIRQTSKPAYLEVNLDCYRRGYAAAVEVAETR
jgi:Pyruvate/2-oxoacid:ferredoxin oxidoreductase gamma subunit